MKTTKYCTNSLLLFAALSILNPSVGLADPLLQNVLAVTHGLLRNAPPILPALYDAFLNVRTVQRSSPEPDFVRARAFFENGVRVLFPGLEEHGPQGVQERVDHILAEQFVDALEPDAQAVFALNLFMPEAFVAPGVPPHGVIAAAVPVAAEPNIAPPISGSARVSIVLPRGQRAMAYTASERMLSQNLREYALSEPRDVLNEGTLTVEARGLVEVSPMIQVVPVALIVAITKKREVLNRPLRCLIADDQPLNLKILRRLLSSFTPDLGFEIELFEAGNGDVALEILKEHQERGNPIDIAIFDKQMAAHGKGLDGHLAAEEWRAIEVASHLQRMPIIAFTGSTTVEDVAECKKAGIDVFLRKGLNGRAQLLDAILELVHIRLPEKEIAKQAGATASRSPGSSSFSGKS